MPGRPERRRRQRAAVSAGGAASTSALIRPRELLIAAVTGGVLVAALAFFLILSGGGGTPFSATTPDEQAIEALARESIEVLPRGEWPSLYDSFTPEFQQRCSRTEFEAAGEAGAREQGEKLPLLHFVRLEAVTIQGETATATIVGEITGESEYKVRAAFQKLEGTWKLAPAASLGGCAAFDRVAQP